MHFPGAYLKPFEILKVLVIICTINAVSTSICTSLPANLSCNCDALEIECSGVQTNISEIQDFLVNFSSVPNVAVKVSGLNFEPPFKFENISIRNLTLGYGLANLPSDFLSELGPSLVSLNLNNNSIEHIDDQLFSSLSSLTELHLDFNQLIELESSMFANLISLTYLSVASNDFYEVSPITFENLLSLHTLILSHNNISEFKKINIKSSSLIVLKVDGCLIQGTLDKDTFHDLPNLKELDLSYNRLSEIKPHCLPSMKHLQSLNLSHNAIEFLQENAFFELRNLTFLDLKANKVSLIKMTSFAGLLNLKYLDLSGNRLKAVLCDYTTDLIALERIYLENNEIKSFTTGAFYYSPLLQELGLKSNNLECSCALTDTVHYLIENSTMSKADLESVFCIVTSTLGYMPITDYKSSKCIPEEPCKKLSDTSTDDYDYDYSDESIISSTVITTSTTSPSTLVSTTPSTSSDTSTQNQTSSLIITEVTTYITTPSDTSTESNSTNSSDIVTVSESTTFHTSSPVEITTDIVSVENANMTTNSINFTNLTDVTTINTTYNDNFTDPYTVSVVTTSSKVNTEITETSSDANETILPTSEETKTTFYTTTIISPETTQTVLSTSDKATTVISTTKSDIFTSSEKSSTALTPKVTSIVSTSKYLCSDLELSLDSLSSDSDFAVIKNFSYSNNIFCLKWTVGSILPPKSRCIIKYTFSDGTKSVNLKCPAFPGEVKLWSKNLKVFRFCITIHAGSVSTSCSQVSTTTTTGHDNATVSIVSQTPSTSNFSTQTATTTEKYTESSTESSTFNPTESLTKNELKTDSTTFTIMPIIHSTIFNVTAFDVYFNDSSFAYVKWAVNMEQSQDICSLTLTATTQYFDHNEGTFPCKRHTHKLRNVMEDEIFKLCLVSQHKSSGYNTICRYSLASANFDAEASKSNDDTNNSSFLIPLICLLVVLVLILIFIIFRNIFKKKQDSDRYDVRAEEEKSQRVEIRPASSHDRSSVRYSYIAKENPDS